MKGFGPEPELLLPYSNLMSPLYCIQVTGQKGMLPLCVESEHLGLPKGLLPKKGVPADWAASSQNCICHLTKGNMKTSMNTVLSVEHV